MLFASELIDSWILNRVVGALVAEAEYAAATDPQRRVHLSAELSHALSRLGCAFMDKYKDSANKENIEFREKCAPYAAKSNAGKIAAEARYLAGRKAAPKKAPAKKRNRKLARRVH